jgi:uncharacterized membrane protein
MNEAEVMKFGFLGGILEATYCFLIASGLLILSNTMPQPKVPLVGFLLFLLLFVFSAAISGILVFGYPGYLVIQKRYQEALMTFLTTLVTIAIIGLLIFVLISLI